ncbi:MAG: hypothetical protein EOM73_13115 [Bacteroidia bacterium]|nr:hypothetical protein [Bacteroidia bacterium]
MFVIANVDPRGNNSVDLKKLQAYADVIDCGYMFGPPGGTNEPPEINNPILNKFFSERNKLFMPCLHGGYYGAWLKSGNDFYQPFYGVDMLHNTFLAAQKLDSPWIHLTSYNDLIETAMMPRAFTFGMEQLIRAYSNAHKKTGTLFAEPEIIFSYHREEQPGTLFRIEAMNLPSVGNAAVIVRGRLLDMDGKPVFELPPKRFAPDAFGRAEWLVSTTNLVRSPYLVPEFSAEAGDWKHIVRAPAVFFVSSWLQNAVTMTVPLSGLTDISNSLKINYSADRLHAEIKFDSPCELKRAVLFKNDRPVALFSPDLKAEETMLVCKLTNT